MGMDMDDDECLEVCKGMYGLSQSSRVYWMTVTEYLTSEDMGFEQCKVDQCLFVKKTERGLLIVLLYVDDSAIIGCREDIDEFCENVRKRFKVKVEGGLNDFLGCDILREKDKDECWILQPHLIRKLKETFGKCLEGRKPTNTPGTPRRIQVTNGDEKEKLDKAGHKLFRSGVGS